MGGPFDTLRDIQALQDKVGTRLEAATAATQNLERTILQLDNTLKDFLREIKKQA